MRKILVSAIALLAIAGAANAFVITAPSNVDGGNGVTGIADLAIPITVSGGEVFKSAQISIVLPAGCTILGIDRKAGTLMSASTNAADPAGIYDTTGGAGANAAYSDFAMGFTDPVLPTANGVLGVLHISTLGLAAGTYPILLSDDANGVSSGLADANFVSIAGGQLVAGSFIVTPEPTALALLGLGGLFIRRRRA